MRKDSSLMEIRKAKGLKQKEVAEHLGVCLSAYSMMENGHRRISLENAVKLAALYGCSPETIFYAWAVHGLSSAEDCA